MPFAGDGHASHKGFGLTCYASKHRGLLRSLFVPDAEDSLNLKGEPILCLSTSAWVLKRVIPDVDLGKNVAGLPQTPYSLDDFSNLAWLVKLYEHHHGS